MADHDVRIKRIQGKYNELASLAEKAGFSVDPLDPLAVKCSVGDSCCAGGDRPVVEDRIRTDEERRVADEIKSLQGQYALVVSKMAAEGILNPEVMDLADACACGDACHTGTTDKLKSIIDQVGTQVTRLKEIRGGATTPQKVAELRVQYADLAKKVAEMGDLALGSIDLVGYTCHGGEHCHGGSNRQLDRLSIVSAAAEGLS